MSTRPTSDAESQRLSEEVQREKNWKRWGPYLAERQWGTVREDYSADGSVWEYFPHDHARSRAYRWGEDGLLGWTDRECRLCFAPALWNGRDAILKQRLFGLTGPEGNHGEDVKELYYYLDSSPTHSYCKALYKYPQAAFPYDHLVEENNKRSRDDDEYEIIDTGVFDDDRYFDVTVEYAKQSPNDILIRLTVCNRGPETATVHVLPTLWFRNTWIWGCAHEGCTLKPRIARADDQRVTTEHETLGRFDFAAEQPPDHWLFTDNHTNAERLFDGENVTRYTKDAFERWLIDRERDAVNPEQHGTMTTPLYELTLESGGSHTLNFRLFSEDETPDEPFGPEFDEIFTRRFEETEDYYEKHMPEHLDAEARNVTRQAYAGLMWSKQFYHLVVDDWLTGDAHVAPPPPQRIDQARNKDWRHLYSRDVLSMPDKWEYPWFAAWDTAFHMIPMARIDPAFAKKQLLLMLREWYMHPNGQLPAYEFNFNDVNPPVHAWACWRVYKMTAPRGERDYDFLARCFQKLIVNFTWWVNRKDPHGKNLFAGGFLGLDNIGVFDRSSDLPGDGHLHQADGTAWMAFYCGTMLSMAIELAQYDRAYEDMASKFFEHFVAITDAMNTLGGTGLWDEHDGFYYDQLQLEDEVHHMKVRSLVGLIPLCAVEVLTRGRIEKLTGFRKRARWFLKYRQDLAQHIAYLEKDETEARHYLLAIPSRDRLRRVLAYMLDENEFLSPFGIRSLSAYHREHPFELDLDDQTHRIEYEPGESRTAMFGGNSNWRGPIWLPLNFLLIESLERYHYFYGDALTVEYPTGSGKLMNLRDIAADLRRRIASLFLRDPKTGRRPCHGGDTRYHDDPNFRDLLLFNEYFHGDTGRGLGASHQTGWTALVVNCLEQVEDRRHTPREPGIVA